MIERDRYLLSILTSTPFPRALVAGASDKPTIVQVIGWRELPLEQGCQRDSRLRKMGFARHCWRRLGCAEICSRYGGCFLPRLWKLHGASRRKLLAHRRKTLWLQAWRDQRTERVLAGCRHDMVMDRCPALGSSGAGENKV
ncbi:hypothetical protein KCP74_21325 [Salmonella enterica subsp. enterica]|nr:hypothetical protein KCP74_21325 [Salmonella enterica subsp. enterica]